MSFVCQKINWLQEFLVSKVVCQFLSWLKVFLTKWMYEGTLFLK